MADEGASDRASGSSPLRRVRFPHAQPDRQLEFELTTPATAKTSGRDRQLEEWARSLLLGQGASALAARVQIEWSARLRTAAGRAEYRRARVLLNCRLAEHGEAETDRTLRHELAHLLAQSRVGRRRIAPHGAEWRQACADLGIPGEARCHDLPFPTRQLERRYVYVCAHCRREFPRTRPLRRASACFSCCREFNRGRYDQRYRLQRVNNEAV